MPHQFEPLPLDHLLTTPLARRSHKVAVPDFARVLPKGASMAAFVDALPKQLAGLEFRAAVDAVASAHKNDRPVIWSMGAHIIKCGLSPWVVELMRADVISLVAMNGAGAIHDIEVALVGETSEDVSTLLGDGTFGAAEETGAFMAEALENGEGGMGGRLGKALLASRPPHLEHSILGQAAVLGLPVTVHVALGTDTAHMHPKADGARIGEASLYDFRLLAGAVAQLSGGVYLSVGSAVILPEVFLKALTAARNLGHDVRDFTTVNMDMIQHYRPVENVLRRPTRTGGRGIALTGHHEIMVPLLCHAVMELITK